MTSSKKVYFFIAISFCFSLNAQNNKGAVAGELVMVENINSLEYGNSQEAAELCVALRGNNFKRNSQVESGLDDILATIGASKRFRLQPCNVNNASAVTILGIRYILYDIDFMNSISNGSSWGNTFILAHEVGHHINGHTMDAALHSLDIIDPTSLSDLRTQELEADEFAGFVLAKLGGPLSAAKETITSISNNSSDIASTHPARYKRLKAVETGYNNANKKKAIPTTLVLYDGEPLSPKAISYYDSAKSYVSKNENYQAISNYLLAAKGGFRFGYFKSASIKEQLGDTKGAMMDYSLYIDNGGDWPWAFINRGLLFMNDENWENALDDFNNALELDPFGENCFHNYNALAHCKAVLGDMDGACEMWNKALEFESLKNSATMNIIDYCQ